MAKTASITRALEGGLQMGLPVNGRWTWNENSSNLEYLSNNPHAEKLEKKKDRSRGGRGGLHAYDSHKKADRGATPSIGSRAFGQSRQSRIPAHRSSPAARQTNKHSGDHTHITLDDVKSLALNMMSEVYNVSDVFEGMYSTDQFDEFLLFLLNYFHCFFEKRTHEQKPNPMNIEPSLKDVKYYEDLCLKLEAAQKTLGKAYCVLVLGIGLVNQHHMACGMSRVSSTYKDRSMYETFYSFCTFVVWIAFRRREFEVVKKEIGRMLRSETFNPSLRVKNAPEEEKEKKEEAENEGDIEKLTPAEYRRKQGRRPPIKSIINQRSPALVSILPSPKEESNWLFKRTGGLSPTFLGIEISAVRCTVASSMAAIGREDLSEDSLQGQFQHLKIDVSKLKVGIVGEPANQYNPMTLTPLDAETEEDGNEDGEKQCSTRQDSQSGKTPQSAGDADLSRQVTAVSQATTDALPDDDD